MAGYSGTPLPKKLGIREGHRVALLDAPPMFTKILGTPPVGVSVRRSATGSHTVDVIVLFARAMKDLTRRLGPAAEALAYDGGLWIAWPKKASGVATDVTENLVRQTALAMGLVDNKVCAIDDVWSGLRAVYRVKDRPR